MKSLFYAKRFNKVFVTWFSFFCIVVFVQLNSCKKDSNNADPQKIVPSHYINSETNQEFFIYDARPDNSSAVIRRISSDTTYNYLFDRLDRVKSIYLSVGGTLDSTLLTFDYTDSIIVISRYSVDWQSGNSEFASLAKVTKKQLSAIIPEIMNDFPMGGKMKNGQDYFCKTTTSVIVTTVVFGLIGVVICNGAAPICAIIAGMGVGIVCIPSGNAAEPPPATYPPNPVIQFNETFPVNNTNELLDYEWMISCASGTGGEGLEFKENGITLNPLNNFKGTYALQGRNIKFTYAFCCTSCTILIQGTNYYVGTVSADGKHINGIICSLNNNVIPYPFYMFSADGY